MVELQTRIKAIKEDLKETDDVYEFLKNSTSNTLGTGLNFDSHLTIDSVYCTVYPWIPQYKPVNISYQFFNTYYLSETMLLSETSILG